MKKADEESIEYAIKQVDKEYINAIREKLLTFTCFSDKNQYIYSNKLYIDMIETRIDIDPDTKFDFMINAINKCTIVSDCFKTYRYILAIFKNSLPKQIKEGSIDEGDTF